MKKKLDKMVNRNDNFAKWYTNIVLNAGLINYGSVKGTIIFKPYGFAIWERIKELLDKELKKNGVENLYLPLLIPKSMFEKEKKQIEGFSPECLTVTKVGDKILDEELYIRPTSEVLFGDFFSQEIRTYRDLPKIYNQWANVFRWEKTTRPFLRNSEFLWQEGHTMHNNKKEAQDLTLKIINLYSKFLKEKLSIPTILGKKTEKEKFAGAIYTYTIESIMYDGQALQSGTSHYFGDNFSKTFNVKFLNKENKNEYAYYTSWGVSTRLIGAIIMSHADDNGLLLPSSIAPSQINIVIVKNNEKLLKAANDVKHILSRYRVAIDLSDKSFGYKISESEIKGYPIRIEIGERDLENKSVTVVRRDRFKKKIKKISELRDYINRSLRTYDKILYDRINERNHNIIKKVKDFNEYKKLLKIGNYVALVPFCGVIKCEEEIKQKTQTNSRCILLEEYKKNEKCFHCNSKALYEVYFARSY